MMARIGSMTAPLVINIVRFDLDVNISRQNSLKTFF